MAKINDKILQKGELMTTVSDYDKLRKIDLNCIKFFLAVMKYRTIYNASVALKCSSPTVSLMLKRFCDYFPFPLFVREGRCLTPTKYGIELNKKLELIFQELEVTLCLE